MKLISELIYLSINTQPDIAYVVNMLAQYNANPEARHFVAAKQILHHLVETIELKLHYGGDKATDVLHAYADASWANSVGRRSISGYIWFYVGRLISHVSQKQSTIALSSMEAEYMAATHVVQEGLWLKSLLTSFTSSFPPQSRFILTTRAPLDCLPPLSFMIARSILICAIISSDTISIEKFSFFNGFLHIQWLKKSSGCLDVFH
jgi:hypothetical protein